MGAVKHWRDEYGRVRILDEVVCNVVKREGQSVMIQSERSTNLGPTLPACERNDVSRREANAALSAPRRLATRC